MNKHKFTFSIPSLGIKMPGLSRLRLPLPGGVYLGGGTLIVGSLTTVGLGFLMSMFILVSSGDQEITWPMVGASYDAPSMIGVKVVDAEFPADTSQTLQLNLPSGIRLDTVSFINVSLGKAGLTNSFEIQGTSSGYIVIDEIIIKGGSEFPTMDWANSEFYTLVASTSVETAGHTMSPTMSATTSEFSIGSTRGAAQYEAEDMIVDRIIIKHASGTGDILIRRLIIDGVKAHTGAFDADYVKAGKITFSDLRIGNDGNINTPSAVWNTTVHVTNLTDGIVDKPVFIR